MTARLIRKLRRGGEIAVAALLVAAAGRFTYVAAAPLLTKSEELDDLSAEGLTALDDGPQVVRREELAPIGSTGKAAGSAAPEPEPEPATELISVLISVTYGSQRSAIYVDGAPLGHTAFAGDLTCRRDTDVTIRIVPPRGPAVERVRRCDGSMITVAE